jgi:hypothetical protein
VVSIDLEVKLRWFRIFWFFWLTVEKVWKVFDVCITINGREY